MRPLALLLLALLLAHCTTFTGYTPDSSAAPLDATAPSDASCAAADGAGCG